MADDERHRACPTARVIGRDGEAVAVVLASASPRRRDLLARLGLAVDVRPVDVDETPRPSEHPFDLAHRLAVDKAEAARAGLGPGEVVIAADTVVCVDGDPLGKPVDAADAVSMLTRLSGRSHHVATGVAVVTTADSASTVEVTEVTFRALTAGDIEAYVACGEPMDKAGAYAIQGRGGMFVTGITGSDTNVVGLPLATTVALLEQIGVTLRPGP